MSLSAFNIYIIYFNFLFYSIQFYLTITKNIYLYLFIVVYSCLCVFMFLYGSLWFFMVI